MVDQGISRRAEYAELTKAAILDAAAQAFVDPGYAATGLDEIGKAARVSKGAVYHHFSDKPGLFAAVFEARCLDALTGIENASADDADPHAMIATAISSMLDAYADDRALRELSRQAGQAIGEQRRRELQQGRSLSFVRGIFELADQRGILRGGIDVDIAARSVLEVVFDGAVTYAEAPDEPGYRDRVQAVLVAMVSGLLVDK